jgi:hypothetical protein
MISLDDAQRLDGERETAFARLAGALAPLRELYARHRSAQH